MRSAATTPASRRLHHLDLDFGRRGAANRAVLVLNGWVDWADGSTFLAASQDAKRGLTFPYLQVKDAAGQWQTVIEDMGMPAGKPKTIAVDLTGKFLSASREVRIVTNLCVYWDEIFLSEERRAAGRATDARRRSIRAICISADSRKSTIDPRAQAAGAFDYADVDAAVDLESDAGTVHALRRRAANCSQAVDDRLVIMGSGDELQLRFRAAGLPPLAAGWKRDFLLLVDGWAKDARRQHRILAIRGALAVPRHERVIRIPRRAFSRRCGAPRIPGANTTPDPRCG